MDRERREIGDLAGERRRLGAEGRLGGGRRAGHRLEGGGLDRSGHRADGRHRDDPDPRLPESDRERLKSRAGAGGAGRLFGRPWAALPGVGEEDLLQARLVAAEVDDLAAGQGAEEALEVAVEREADAVALADEHLQPVYLAELLQRGHAVEEDLDLVEVDVVQLLQLGDPDQAPLPKDPDPVADVFDLGEDVGGEEDSGAVCARLAEVAIELLLDESVEASGGL